MLEELAGAASESSASPTSSNDTNVPFKGARSNADCHYIYEAELRRCELAKECCPQFDRWV